MAYMYSCENLKKSISSFLSANRGKGHFTKLAASNEWFKFAVENPELANEIFTDISDKMGVDF
jgi:hypothetical protein